MAVTELKAQKCYRNDFPIFAQKMNGQPLVYLDTASSAQKPRLVLDAMNDTLTQHYANIHRGLYAFSQATTEAFEAVREKVKLFLGARQGYEAVFTRNTTEAINLVASSWGRQNLTADDEIILTRMEHHANIVPWQLLQTDIGFTIKTIELTNDGTLDVESLEQLVTPKTKLLSLVHISNALGVVNPVKEIIAKAKSLNNSIVTLVDGTQSVVHGQVDVQDLGCDFFSFTGHKLYGPNGIGILCGKTALLNEMSPYQGGGDMIESVSFEKCTTFKNAPARFEAGTPAIAEVIGLGAAIDYVSSIGHETIMRHEKELLDYTLQAFNEMGDVTVYAANAVKAGVFSFNLDGAHSSDVAMILDQCGVAVRTGHHCCMPLMEFLGVDSTVRCSFGIYNTIEDCDRLIEALKKAKKLLG